VVGEAMLDLVKDETELIRSCFLETACGSSNILVKILWRNGTSRLISAEQVRKTLAFAGKDSITVPKRQWAYREWLLQLVWRAS